MKDSQKSKRKHQNPANFSGVSRRNFVKGAATIAAAASTVPMVPLLSNKESVAEAATGNGNSAIRATNCLQYRVNTALAERINVGPQSGNGDITRFTDFSGNYSKALLHDSLGVPNTAAYLSLTNAFGEGGVQDFANIIVGNPGGGPNSQLNGPQGALAFDLEGLDSHGTVIPPAPSVASPSSSRKQEN
jgi:hypothetical protein